MPSDKEIILYHYHYSPFARRIVWYLQFRKIPYSQCLQPVTLPRPDVNSLGIQYRRIPLMAIGRDVYCDTRLILSKLETLYPASSAHPSLSASTPEHLAIQQLLSKWIVDGPIFMRASQLIPTSMPLLNDPKFTRDREAMTGRPWSKENVERMRPEAVAAIKGAFSFLEGTLLVDGRDWVLGTPKPTLADIEAVFVFVWLHGLPGALEPQHISPKQFPKVFAWIERFNGAAATAAKAAGKPKTYKGPEAMKIIGAAPDAEVIEGVQKGDVSGLREGQLVEICPTDSGFKNKDRGRLIGLQVDEIVFETKSEEGKTIRVHTPRNGFRVKALDGEAKL